jgi:hypothetical protein
MSKKEKVRYNSTYALGQIKGAETGDMQGGGQN